MKSSILGLPFRAANFFRAPYPGLQPGLSQRRAFSPED